MDLAFSQKPLSPSRDHPRLSGAIVLSVILAVLLGWLIWTARTAETERAAANQLELRTLHVLQTTDAILKAAVDSETGQRGFILTRDELFLEPFQSGHRLLPIHIEELKRLTTDNSRQQANSALVAKLATERLDQIDTTIAKVRDGSIGQLDLLIFMRRGKQTMDQLRATVARIETEEHRLLAIRKAAADRAEDRAGQWRLVLSFFALILLAVCIAAFFTLFRAWRDAGEQRREAEANLRLAEGQRLLQAIMDSSADAIFTKNRAGRVLFTNRRFNEIRGALVAQNAQDLPHLDDIPLSPSDIEVMETGETRIIEEQIVLDGSSRTLMIEKMPWLRAGVVVGMIAISRDVTENKLREAELQEMVERRTSELRIAIDTLKSEMAERETAEEALRQMQRIESLGQMTGGIAHDFNNMLAIVLGSLAMARRRIPDDADPKLAIAIDNAEEGAARAADLTKRLLAFARVQPLDAKPLEINQLVTKAGRMLERTLGGRIELALDLDPQAGWTEIDAPQMESALINLAVNARDAMPGGGTLTLGTRRDGHMVTVTVADTGEGMPDAVKLRAFEPFFTTKHIGKGTGLGLSQVHGFIVQSGGSVDIESAPDKGTCISLTLPSASDPRELGAAQAAPARQGRSEVILIVEDEPLVRKVAEETLALQGYQPVVAASGEEALAILAGRSDIALMLTDIALPGIDGKALAVQSQADHPKLKVILTTGYDTMDKTGMVWPVLNKPYMAEELAAMVGEALNAGILTAT